MRGLLRIVVFMHFRGYYSYVEVVGNFSNKRKGADTMASQKGIRLNYEATHKKLREAIDSIIKEGEELTVSKVAKKAGVCLSTAYNHECQEMIRQAISGK